MSTAVEHYDADAISPARWDQMEREARVFAKSGKVPKEYEGKPDAIMAVLITANELGLKAGLNTLSSFHFIEGKAVPSAQLMIALARNAGHDIRTTFVDDTHCVVEGRRRGSDQVEEFTYTIDQARRAGQLDPWVEQWASRNNRNFLEKYFLKVRGEDNPTPPPEWAKKLIAAGQVKTKEAWLRYPEDLLKASAIRRACRSVCPDVLLGLADGEDLGGSSGSPSQPSTPAAAPAVQHEDIDGDDEDIVDAEIVEEKVPPGDDDATPPTEVESSSEAAPSPDELVSQDWRMQFAVAAKNQNWNEAQRHEILHYATGGRVRSSKELRRSETTAVVRTVRQLIDGELRFFELDDAWHVGPRSAEEAPPSQETFFEESA